MTEIPDDQLVVAPGGPRPKSTVTHVHPGEAVDAGAGRRASSPPRRRGPRHHPRWPAAARGRPPRRGGVRLVDAQGAAPACRPGAEDRARGPTCGALQPWAGLGSAPPWAAAGSPIRAGRTPRGRRSRRSPRPGPFPGPRARTHGQTIFLFNGIEPGDFSHILQPVLQWGPSAAGGGASWSVASWYVGGGNAFHTNLVRGRRGRRPRRRHDPDRGTAANAFNYISAVLRASPDTTLTVTTTPS